ncbi:MAG: hypothetical protein LR015_06160 [Verrucomicrobia bacterium]|nr:hypothetical protein [Verrucomicrobiota bacterium]
MAKFEALEARLRSSIEDADKIRMDLERNYHELHVAHQDLAIRSEQLQLDLDKARTELELYKQQSGNDNEAMATLISETAELKSALQRKESALKDLEAAYKSASAETSYEAHRHMQWTLNHFDPDAITLKFQNEGAAVYLVGVETNEPALTYNLETGHSLPRDFEARVRLKFRKGTPANQAKFPESFDLTVLYALHVFPIKFRIHPQAGQKIERIH